MKIIEEDKTHISCEHLGLRFKLSKKAIRAAKRKNIELVDIYKQAIEAANKNRNK